MNNLANTLSRLAPVKSGDSSYDTLSAERINAIQDAIRALAGGANIRSGVGIRIQAGPDWVVVSARDASGRGGGGAASGAYQMPFDVTVSGNTVSIVPGYICNQEPTQVAPVAGWQCDAAAGHIFLHVEIYATTSEVLTREIKFAAEVPTPTESSDVFHGYLDIATIAASGDGWAVTQHYNGSRWAAVIISNIVCESGGLTLERSLAWS